MTFTFPAASPPTSLKRVAGTLALLFLLALLALMPPGAMAQTPLSLDEVLRTVREKSDETQIIREKSAKLDAMKRELWAGAMPQVTAYANAGRGASPFNLGTLPLGGDTGQALPPVYSATQNMFSYGLQVNQSLYAFGRLGQSFRTANLQIRSQDAANVRSLQELELAALDAFYAVRIAEARLRVLDASLERQKRTSAFLEANFRRGAGTRGTVLLTAAALKGLEPERIRAARDADAARMALNRLLGRDVRDTLVLDTTAATDITAPAVNLTEPGLQGLLDRRPDLAALQLQKETLRGYATAYRMLYRPALGFQGKVGILAYELDDQLTDFDNNLEWQVGVGFTWPLFDGLAMSSKARQYDSDARSIAVSERQARAFARIEIEAAHREVDAADTALGAARQARDASAEALDLIAQDFRAGSGQITDLLSAEEGLRNAELALLSAGYQKTRARAALRLALGMNLLEENSK